MGTQEKIAQYGSRKRREIAERVKATWKGKRGKIAQNMALKRFKLTCRHKQDTRKGGEHITKLNQEQNHAKKEKKEKKQVPRMNATQLWQIFNSLLRALKHKELLCSNPPIRNHNKTMKVGVYLQPGL